MQQESARTAQGATQRTRRGPRRRLARAGVVSLAGALALTGVSASLASASTAHRATPAAKKPSPASALATAEKELTSLETPPSGSVKVNEAGSSLFYPLFAAWASAYPNKSITINAAAGGSGAGASGAEDGTLQIGASDAYLPPSTLSADGVVDIPEVVSAQTIDYNIPGISQGTHLKFTPSILNGIYSGSITNWDSSAIASVNKGVKLPNLTIVPLKRSDSSGDTFLFTSYLDFGDPSSFIVSEGGPTESTASWPKVTGETAESGNSGMLSGCEGIKGCIAYIGISYLRGALKGGLGYGALLNGYSLHHAKGNYILPNNGSIEAEIDSFTKIPSNGAISLIYSHSAPNGYPIVNFEYAIVKTSQPSSTMAQAVKAVLAWGMDPRKGASSSLLEPVDFRSMPTNGLDVAINLLKRIS